MQTTMRFANRYESTTNEGAHHLTEFEYEHAETGGAFSVVIYYERVYTEGYPDDFNPWAVGIKVSGDLNLTSMPLLGASALIASAVALHHQLGHHVEFDNDVNVAR